jgi:signal transduction histidine kinase
MKIIPSRQQNEQHIHTHKHTYIHAYIHTYIHTQVLNTISATRQPNVTITNRVASTLPAVKVDGQRMCQILYNLVGNAIKFTPKGSIEISAEVVSGDEDMVAVTVQDTGVGISEKDIDTIFVPFEQGIYLSFLGCVCVCVCVYACARLCMMCA